MNLLFKLSSIQPFLKTYVRFPYLCIFQYFPVKDILIQTINALITFATRLEITMCSFHFENHQCQIDCKCHFLNIDKKLLLIITYT